MLDHGDAVKKNGIIPLRTADKNESPFLTTSAAAIDTNVLSSAQVMLKELMRKSLEDGGKERIHKICVCTVDNMW